MTLLYSSFPFVTSQRMREERDTDSMCNLHPTHIRRRFELIEAFNVHRLHETRGSRNSRVDNTIWSVDFHIPRKLDAQNFRYVDMPSALVLSSFFSALASGRVDYDLAC